MADPETVDEVVADPAEDEAEEVAVEEQEEQAPVEDEAPEDEQAEEDALTVSFGDEPEAEDVPQTPAIRQIRQAHREAVRALRQKERELEEARQKLQAPQVTADPGKEPDPDDFEMFTEEGKAKFKAEWASWNTRKQQAEAAQAEVRRKQEAEREAWNRTLAEYGTKKQAVKAKAPDFDEAEEAFKDAFSDVQQGLVVHCAADPALMVYALGKSPSKMRALSEIKDPAKFAVKLGELQAKMKVESKKSPPPPERVPRANVSGGAATKGQLERLQAEAQRTGDYSKYFAAKRARKT